MEQEIKYFTQAELKKLFKSIEKSTYRHKIRDLAAFRVAYRCGLRASELGLIQLQHYNKQAGELYCTRLKNSWNNTIRLDKETQKVLDKYIRTYGITSSAQLIFTSQEGSPISRKTLDYWMKKYCQDAKIEDKSKWHFHSLKHSCGVHLAESGLDIKEVNFWLAHKIIENTMVYFRFTTKQQEVMYAKLEKQNAFV